MDDGILVLFRNTAGRGGEGRGKEGGEGDVRAVGEGPGAVSYPN